MARRPLSEEKAKAFKEARQKLIKEFDGDHKVAAKYLAPLFHREIVKKLFKADESASFDLSQVDRLIWYMGENKSRIAYNVLSDLIGSDRGIGRGLEKLLCGEYKYFRHYAPLADHKSLVFVQGKIIVYFDDGILRFNHWSHTHLTDEKPEHKGFVFSTSTNLFFLGMKPGTLRLAICEKPENGGRDALSLRGLVLSVRSGWPYDAFSARFVMVPTENQDLVSQLSNKERVKYKGPPMPEEVESTLGREKFFELTYGRYAYLMLSLHLLLKDVQSESP